MSTFVFVVACLPAAVFVWCYDLMPITYIQAVSVGRPHRVNAQIFTPGILYFVGFPYITTLPVWCCSFALIVGRNHNHSRTAARIVASQIVHFDFLLFIYKTTKTFGASTRLPRLDSMCLFGCSGRDDWLLFSINVVLTGRDRFAARATTSLFLLQRTYVAAN